MDVEIFGKLSIWEHMTIEWVMQYNIKCTLTNLPLFTLWELEHPEECYAVVKLPELWEEEQSRVKNPLTSKLQKQEVPLFFYFKLRFSANLISLALFLYYKNEWACDVSKQWALLRDSTHVTKEQER